MLPSTPTLDRRISMTEHPLGDVNGSAPTATVDKTSLVDSVLDLDDFLARDVRLALKQAAFYTKPELEADIEELNAELDSLVDAAGRPLPDTDRSMEEGRTFETVRMELAAAQKAYAASRRVILVQQLDQDDWDAFQTKWKEDLAKQPPYPPEFYEDLIVQCAHKPTFTVEQVRTFRKKVGAPAFEQLWQAAWEVNTRSGVSIPKSWLSSTVQRQPQLG